jgi:ubiquinone/menaquinone biosynthesis C-methylase UbiE
MKDRRKTYAAHLWDADYFILLSLKKSLLDSISQYIKPNHQVLDIGCGEQPLKSLVIKAGGIYTSADISQNSAHSVDHICPITNIPVATASYDTVLCTEVLEHVSATHKAFKELYRVLKTGGCLIVTTPFLYPLHEEPYDYVRLTAHQFKEIASTTGLKIIYLRQSGNAFEVIAQMLNHILCYPCQYYVTKSWFLRNLYCLAIRPVVGLVNLLTLLLTLTLGRWLPRTMYLDTQIILQK